MAADSSDGRLFEAINDSPGNGGATAGRPLVVLSRSQDENGFRQSSGYTGAVVNRVLDPSTAGADMLSANLHVSRGMRVFRPTRPAVLAMSAVAVAAVALVFTAACVSPPRAVGPTTLTGTLPAASIGASASAERAPGAIDGPLQILDPRFAWRHASPTAAAYAWQCFVDNPSQSTFDVTVVMQLLDVNGRPLASSNQAFRLDGRKSVPVAGDGTIDGDVAVQVASWRLEYWVKVPPRPPRDGSPNSPATPDEQQAQDGSRRTDGPRAHG